MEGGVMKSLNDSFYKTKCSAYEKCRSYVS